jgi:LacI family transcriptional regulator
MRPRRRTNDPPEVTLLTETSTEYGRALLRGVLRYSRLHGPWSLYVVPEHLDKSLPTKGSWPGDGILARVGSPEMRRRIRASRLPSVVSTMYEAEEPRVGPKSGEIRTDCDAISRMAALHLMETGLRRFAFCGFEDCQWSLRREKAFLQVVQNYEIGRAHV